MEETLWLQDAILKMAFADVEINMDDPSNIIERLKLREWNLHAIPVVIAFEIADSQRQLEITQEAHLARKVERF